MAKKSELIKLDWLPEFMSKQKKACEQAAKTKKWKTLGKREELFSAGKLGRTIEARSNEESKAFMLFWRYFIVDFIFYRIMQELKRAEHSLNWFQQKRKTNFEFSGFMNKQKKK